MAFDINETLAQMLGVVKTTVEDNWSEVKETANEFLQRRKVRLELLADMRILGEITQKRLESRLEDERLLLEAELHAIAVITKAIAQKAANAAFDILNKAIKLAIKI